MSQKSGLETWKATVIEHMPHLSVPEASVSRMCDSSGLDSG